MLYKYLAIVVMYLMVLPNQGQKYSTKNAPHIIYFLVDDWGHFDINLNGMRAIPTKNLNRLAKEGVFLKNYYVAPVCTPTRASLMTGLYDSNTGLHTAYGDASPFGLPLTLKTLPQWLNGKGYVSRMIGKWHLGYYEKVYTPTMRGFKTHYGFWNGFNDMFIHHSVQSGPASSYANLMPDYPRFPGTDDVILLDGYDLRDNMNVTDGGNEYLTDLFTKKAEDAIREHDSSKPLFLYVAHHGVHRGNSRFEMRAPYKYNRYFDYILDRERKNYAGALTAIDVSLGKIMAALESQGMLENSIVVVASDNGSPRKGSGFSNGGSNFPLRGYKFGTFEGGTRVTSFVWSPLIKTPRSIFNGLIHVCDWLPTFYAAAGGDVKDLENIDGLNMWEAISTGTLSPRNELLVHYDPVSNTSGFILNNFKLVTGIKNLQNYDGMTLLPESELSVPEKISLPTETDLVEQILNRFYAKEDNYGSESYAVFEPVECGQKKNESIYNCTTNNEFCLFNLNDDPCEMNNVAQENPEVLKIMINKLKLLRGKAVPAQTPRSDYLSNPYFYDGVWTNYKDAENIIMPINNTN